ncbi:MAG: hypothetical protein IT247_01835, partial [Bacteroidia bacterium]|nr:hypothetical protein [Bacteroidia bacterium]
MIKKLPFKIITVCVLFFAWSQTFGQGVWKQTGSNINGSHAGNNFGTTIHFAAGGNTFAAASVNDSTSGSLRGQVRVFTRSGNSWVQKGANLTGVANGDFFGRSVALDSVGNTIAIGGPYNDAGLGSMSTAGHVKVYSWSGSAWTQKGSTLLADSAGENFGYSVSISYDGNTLAIGIPFGRDTLDVYRGRVKIYRWNGTAWNQLGKSLLGLNKNDVFGNAVSLDRTGNTVAIGAPFHSAGGPEAGRVSVYNWNNTDTSWHQLGSGIDGDTSDYSGTALSLSADGKRLAIGSPQDIIFGGYGVARMYEWNNTAWVQMGSSIFSPYFADQFGNAISISGDGSMVAVGAAVNVTGSEAGRTQVYKWTGSAWTLAGDTIKGVTSGDGAGTAVSLSYNGKLLATGAPMAGGNGANSGITTVMSYCIHNSSTVNITSCSGNYISPSGKYTWTTNGVYNDTIPNNGGCDSVITINLTIGTKPTVNVGTDISTCTSTTLDAGNPGSTYLWNNNDTTRTLTASTSGTYFVKVTNNGCFAYDTITVTITSLDTAVSLSGTVLTAAQNGASYQWLDCKNGLQAVAGGVNKTFNLVGCAGDTYSYAVEITKNGCKDTSSCQTGSLSWFQKGNDVAGEVAGDKAGWAVSLSADGKTMAVGARDNDGNGTDAGHVRIFTWNGTAWVQKGADINGFWGAGNLCGSSVSLSANGETVAVGAQGAIDGSGYACAYTWSGSKWEIKGETV